MATTTTPPPPPPPTSTLPPSYLLETGHVGVGFSTKTSQGFPAMYKCSVACGIVVALGMAAGMVLFLGLWCWYWLRRPCPTLHPQHADAEHFRICLLSGDVMVKRETVNNLVRGPSIKLKQLGRTLSKSPRAGYFDLERHNSDEQPLTGLRAITQPDSLDDKIDPANEICFSPTWNKAPAQNKRSVLKRKRLPPSANGGPPILPEIQIQHSFSPEPRLPGTVNDATGATVYPNTSYGGRGIPRVGFATNAPYAPPTQSTFHSQNPRQHLRVPSSLMVAGGRGRADHSQHSNLSGQR